MRVRFATRLLIPLLVLASFAAAGTESESRDVLEQECPVAVATCGAAAIPWKLSRALASGLDSPAVPASASRRIAGVAPDRRLAAIAPHGRPDNTRGDPLCV